MNQATVLVFSGGTNHLEGYFLPRVTTQEVTKRFGPNPEASMLYPPLHCEGTQTNGDRIAGKGFLPKQALVP